MFFFSVFDRINIRVHFYYVDPNGEETAKYNISHSFIANISLKYPMFVWT